MRVLALVFSLMLAVQPLGSVQGLDKSGSETARPQENALDRFRAAAKKIVDAINSSDYETVTRDFNQAMSAGFPQEKARVFFDALKNKLGKIQGVDAPRLMPPDQALFLTHFERGVLDMKIILDDQNRISGLGFLPVESNPAAKVKTEAKVIETSLRLPFSGRWLVMNGGDTRELNAHHDAPNQVFAFDFVGVDTDGKTATGDGRRNEDYYAFGREVLAPADGVVTVVIQGVPDNAIGSLNPYSALGNMVLLEHQKGEVSVLAHLKLGSTRVKVGDQIKAGDVIGSCGNSGNSTKPHLHYHLQDTSIIQDGKGIKIYFQKVFVNRDGKTKLEEKYSPIKGEILSYDSRSS